MYGNEKWLKVISIILIIYGAFSVLGFLSLTIISLGAYAIDAFEGVINLSGMLAAALFYAVQAVFNLLAGIIGLRALNGKGKENLLKTVGIILLVLSATDLLYGLISPPFHIKDIPQPLIHILIVWGYLKFGENVFTGHRIRDMQQEEKGNNTIGKNTAWKE